MYCNKCGNEILDGEKFCGKCGSKIVIKEKSHSHINTKEKMNKHKTLAIIGIILIFIVGGTIVFNIGILNNKNNIEKSTDKYFETGNKNPKVEANNNNSKIERNWYYNDENNITDGETILHIGDYINYDEQTNATKIQYISTAVKNGYKNQTFRLSDYKFGWRVLGVENGQILITSEDIIGPSEGYIKENEDYDRIYYFLYSDKGYKNAIQELNNICSLYGQGIGSSKARSITVEDINKITGYKPKYQIRGYEYWPPTLTSDFSGPKIGIKTDSMEFSFLFRNHKTNSIIADKYKGDTLGCKYWLASNYADEYFGGNTTDYAIQCVSTGYVSMVTLYAKSVDSSARLVGKTDACVRPVIYLDKYVKLTESYKGSGIYNIEI